MKTLITDLSNEFCISVNELMAFQQTMPADTYTGVGKRTWFTEEGVNLIRHHFTGPHCNSSLLVGQVIEKIVHETETIYQWAKVDQNASVS
jgi:hypothetical protein